MVFYGWRPFGRVKAEGGLAVATMFFHILWLPLVPYRGLIMVNRDQGVKSRLRIRSVMVGYGKIWGPVLLAVAFLLPMSSDSGFDATPGSLAAAAAGIVLVVIGYLPSFSSFDEAQSADIHQDLQSLLRPEAPPDFGTQ